MLMYHSYTGLPKGHRFMNVSSLENFRKEINQTREYIKHIQCVNDVAGYVALETDSEQIKKLLGICKRTSNI